MRKLSALLALVFVLSFAGGVFGQDNRNKRDDRKGRDNQMNGNSNRGRNRGRHGRRHGRRRHNNGKGNNGNKNRRP